MTNQATLEQRTREAWNRVADRTDGRFDILGVELELADVLRAAGEPFTPHDVEAAVEREDARRRALMADVMAGRAETRSNLEDAVVAIGEQRRIRFGSMALADWQSLRALVVERKGSVERDWNETIAARYDTAPGA